MCVPAKQTDSVCSLRSHGLGSARCITMQSAWHCGSWHETGKPCEHHHGVRRKCIEQKPRISRREAVGTVSGNIKGFCKQSWWQEALKSLHLTSSTWSATDPELLNWVFVACAKGQAWEHAMHLLKDLKQGKLSTDVSYTTAIKACNRALHWEVGVVLVSDLLTTSITPNVAWLQSTGSEGGHGVSGGLEPMCGEDQEHLSVDFSWPHLMQLHAKYRP